MTVEAKGLNEVIKVAYKQPVVSKITAVGSDKIERAPTRNILDMASLGPNVQQTRNGGELRIGGARGDGTVYMLDGQVIQGAVTPAQGTVEQLQVFSSGIPANLGDATGGVVSITSKGLTNKLKGNVQAQHSIDGYNQNLVNASFKIWGFQRTVFNKVLPNSPAEYRLRVCKCETVSLTSAQYSAYHHASLSIAVFEGKKLF